MSCVLVDFDCVAEAESVDATRFLNRADLVPVVFLCFSLPGVISVEMSDARCCCYVMLCVVCAGCIDGA